MSPTWLWKATNAPVSVGCGETDGPSEGPAGPVSADSVDGTRGRYFTADAACAAPLAPTCWSVARATSVSGSVSPGMRLVASVWKTTDWPVAARRGWLDGPLPCAPLAVVETRPVWTGFIMRRTNTSATPLVSPLTRFP